MTKIDGHKKSEFYEDKKFSEFKHPKDQSIRRNVSFYRPSNLYRLFKRRIVRQTLKQLLLAQKIFSKQKNRKSHTMLKLKMFYKIFIEHHLKSLKCPCLNVCFYDYGFGDNFAD